MYIYFLCGVIVGYIVCFYRRHQNLITSIDKFVNIISQFTPRSSNVKINESTAKIECIFPDGSHGTLTLPVHIFPHNYRVESNHIIEYRRDNKNYIIGLPHHTVLTIKKFPDDGSHHITIPYQPGQIIEWEKLYNGENELLETYD